jgi:hypothetical protein
VGNLQDHRSSFVLEDSRTTSHRPAVAAASDDIGLDSQRLVRDSTTMDATIETLSIPISGLPSSPATTAGTRTRVAAHISAYFLQRFKNLLHAHRLSPREDEPVDDLPLAAQVVDRPSLRRASASS